jgi:hypothetical protein
MFTEQTSERGEIASENALLAIWERLAKLDPGNTEWQSDLAASYNNIGDVLVAQGHLPEARFNRPGGNVTCGLARSVELVTPYSKLRNFA